MKLVIGLAFCGFFAAVCGLGQANIQQNEGAKTAAKLRGSTQEFTSQERQQESEDPEIERARQLVRMLDDIYKGGIVTITDHYVTEDSEIPAGTAFKQIFAIAKDKGWHEARLLDVTGNPYDDDNVAVDEFEKRAVKKMVEGNLFYEEIQREEGKAYLRVMTPIPVALKKCIWCHSEYEDVPDGQAVGALGYKVPIPALSKSLTEK